MSAFQSVIRTVFSVLSLSFFFCTICFAQGKVDLEVKVQTSSETARGGEIFSYTVTVSNIGSSKASNVILMQDTGNGRVSATPTVGECRILKESQQIPTPYQCLLGDIEQGATVVINFEIKIMDFGGEERIENSANSAILETLGKTIQQSLGENKKGTSIIKVVKQ